MLKWLKEKYKKEYEEAVYKKLKPIFFMLLNLYQNTWDKNLVKQIMSELAYINEEKFYNDKDMNRVINRILDYKEDNK